MKNIAKQRRFREKNCEAAAERPVRIVIDEWWNTPLWDGNNADCVHQCPKGPRDASNWAWLCHRPSLAKERWRVVPWAPFWLIRYEPIGWRCQWVVVEIHTSFEDAQKAIRNY